MDVEKHAIRQALRQRRKDLAPAQVRAAGAAVWARLRAFPPYQSARSVIAYIAHENEVPTAHAIADAVRSNRALYLPRHANGRELVRWCPGDPLVAGPGGVLQPGRRTAESPAEPAIALLPLVAWDSRGTRLGRGGGFYDRVLARLSRGILRIGLGYEFQEYPNLPRDTCDVSLDHVITERRIILCAPGQPLRRESLQKGRLQL